MGGVYNKLMEEIKQFTEVGKVVFTTECYIVKDNKVLLFHRSPASKKFPDVLMCPGGHVDEGEDVLSSAIREVKEETGIVVSKKEIRLKAQALHHHLDRGEAWIIFIYLVNLIKEPALKESDEGSLEWVPIEKALISDKVFQPVQYYFEHSLKDKPGVLYTNVELSGGKITKILSNQTDTDY
jgi:8-oxo-dGTP diphosphatase